MKRVLQNRRIFFMWLTASSLAFSWLLLGPYGDHFRNLVVRSLLLGILIAISLVFLRKTWQGYRFWPAVLANLVAYLVVYQAATFLPGINAHPFTLTWSEGSAYYFASLYFSEGLYGFSAELPLINPTRHMLLAVPFLFSELPIWVHRLWEVILWLSITWLGVYLLVRRLNVDRGIFRWLFAGYVFLYFFQGPIYYFLLISVMPILWGFDRKKFYRTLLLVLIGSAWAGASRVNWIPVPALLAATFYFLEVRLPDKNWLGYLGRPLAWFASGMLAGLLAWWGYAQWSGQPLDNFGIYFTSDLLWYRLLPNATYPGGVLLMSMLASLPLVGLIALHLYRSGFNYHFIRRLGIFSILLVLFSGGLIVSTKIGGGNNIHNLDAYLLILLVTASYLFFDQAAPDFKFPVRASIQKFVNPLVIMAVIIPVFFGLEGGRPVNLPKQSRTENALLTIQEYANQITNSGGKVLFIAERQLLTFGEIEGIPLQPEYERMKLMEMVMGDNEDYLQEFQQRIENMEYDLIVSEPLAAEYKGSGAPFGEENDVYVRQVSEPVLCYYEPVKDIAKFPVQLLMPRPQDEICTNTSRFEAN